MQQNYYIKRLRATVIENHRGEMIPECYLRVKTRHNHSLIVLYHSEFPPALNFHAGDVGYQLDAGDEIEIFARFVDNEMLSTCDDNEYYIRKLG